MKKLLCLLMLAISLPAMAASSAAGLKVGYVQIDKIMQSPASLEVGRTGQGLDDFVRSVP